MSALAKVFVVFIFLLSVTFFGTSATLYLTREDWKSKYATFKDQVTKKIDELEKHAEDQKATIDHQSTRLARVSKSEKVLADDLADARDQLKSKEGELARVRGERDAAIGEKTSTQNELAAEKNRTTTLMAKLEESHTRVEDATTKQKDADARMFRMKGDLDRTTDELSVARIEYEELRSEHTSLQIQMDAITTKLGPDGVLALIRGVAPPIDGIVEDVDPALRLVVLSVGKNDDVKPGYEFTLYRDDKFVAKVQVTKVYDNLSGARILLPEGAVVNKGDRATTRIN